MTADDILAVPSHFGVAETMDRLVAAVTSKNLIVFARVDHGKNARDAGLELRPTELLIFGHGKGGTPLMQDQPLVGLDLPLRVLVWQDSEGKVLLSHHSAISLAERYQLGPKSAAAVTTLEKTLAALTATAAGE